MFRVRQQAGHPARTPPCPTSRQARALRHGRVVEESPEVPQRLMADRVVRGVSRDASSAFHNVWLQSKIPWFAPPVKVATYTRAIARS